MGHTDQKTNLPALVKQWMKANDHTVTETATKIKMPQPTLSNFLKGNTSVSDKLFDQILAALNIDEAALLKPPPALLSDPRRTVPLVSHSTAISAPIITRGVVQGTVPIDTSALHRLPHYCDATRRVEWTRFVAIEVNAEQANYMQLVLKKERPIIIDRHHQKIDRIFRGKLPIYAVALKGKLILGYPSISHRNDHLNVNPASASPEAVPVDIYFDGKLDIDRYIVGRVCNIWADV